MQEMGLTERQRELVDEIVAETALRMSGQLRETTLASASIDEIAVSLRKTKGLGDDIAMSNLERILVTAIVGKLGVMFRNEGYHVKDHYGIVVSLI